MLGLKLVYDENISMKVREVILVTQAQPKFLTIYNTLYEEIQMGKFPGGTALPTEKVLCERFGVSRMTLRQAIKLLTEDGVVESIRGKGHFVVSQHRDHSVSSMAHLAHPLQQMARNVMTLDTIHYRVDLESEYTNHLFPDHPSAVVAMERYYVYEGNDTQQADALCFSFIPINVIDMYDVSTQNQDAVRKFVEEQVYQYAAQSDLKFSTTEKPHFAQDEHMFDGGNHCWLIVETLYSGHESPIMINKWYVPQAKAEINVTRLKEME